MSKIMSKLLKSTLQTAQIEKISWRIQSAVVLALVGISSKIYLGRLKCCFYWLRCWLFMEPTDRLLVHKLFLCICKGKLHWFCVLQLGLTGWMGLVTGWVTIWENPAQYSLKSQANVSATHDHVGWISVDLNVTWGFSQVMISTFIKIDLCQDVVDLAKLTARALILGEWDRKII